MTCIDRDYYALPGQQIAASTSRALRRSGGARRSRRPDGYIALRAGGVGVRDLGGIAAQPAARSAARLHADRLHRRAADVPHRDAAARRRLLKDFIALAKQQPGKLSYAATGRGTMTHLTGELLKSRAGIDVLAVPYTGGAPQALNDKLGGRLSMVIEGLAALSGSIQGGTMKARSRSDRPSGSRVSPTCRPPPRCCPASTRAAGRRWSRRSARPRRSSTRSARRCARWSASPRCRAGSRSPAAMRGRWAPR